MAGPPHLRSTTTPLRGHRTRSLTPRLVLGVAGMVLALVVWQAVSSAGSRGPSAEPPAGCTAPGCRPALADVNAVAAAPLSQAGIPCAYCNQDPNRWRAYTTKAPPEIGGKAAAVVEASCGAMIYGLNENERLPPASLTKMAAALVTVEKGRLDDAVDVRLNGWDLAAEDDSTIMGLEAGMRLSVRDLLYGMMLVSGNDAALELASYLGGTKRLVDAMNAKMRQLGLTNTHFVTPDGRDSPDHYSTALDMALLGRGVLQDPTLKTVVNTKSYTPAWDRGPIWNTNEMIYAYSDAVGVKIGYTETAEFTIVTGMQRDGRLIIVSVLGSWNLYWDAVRLLDWAFENTRPACPS